MNILQIASNMKKNGPALVVYDLAHGLAERGHNVYIAAGKGELAEKFMHPRIHYIYIPIDRVAGNRIKQIYIYSKNAIKTYVLLKSCIKENKIDVINSHQPISNFYAKILSKVMKVPFITTSHNVYRNNFLNRTYVSGDHVVAVSDKVLRNSIEKFKVSESKITCICNGINPNRLMPNEKNKYEGKFVIGTIAGLRKQKSLDNLIQSFYEFHKEVQDSILVICGCGEEDTHLKTIVSELKLKNSVKFLGFRSDVANVLNSFDIFALSSEFEGLPISMLEAMAMKIPVVVTSVGGIPEVVIDGENGIMVNYKDNKAMTAGFIKIYKEKEFRNRIATKGYETVKYMFDYHKMADQYINVYNKVIY